MRIQRFFQILIGIAFVGIIVYLFPRFNNSFNYHFEIGKPWAYNLVTAEFSFPIYKTEEQLKHDKQAALQNIPLCYTVTKKLPHNLLVISLQEMEDFEADNITQIAILDDQHIASTCPVSALHTPKSAYIQTEKSYSPNLQLDTASTNGLRRNALEEVSLTRGMVQVGEKIIDRGEIVTENEYQILQSLKIAYQEKNVSRHQSVLSWSGASLLILLFVIVFVFYLFCFHYPLMEDLRASFFFAILSFLLIATAFIIIRFTDEPLFVFLIPFAWIPVITRAFYDSKVAIALHIMTVCIVALAMPNPFLFLMMQIPIGVVVVCAMKDISQRAQLFHTAAFVLATYAFVYTAYTLSCSGDFRQLQWEAYIFLIINSVLIICAYGIIYVFEKMFGLLSSITLVELANVNSPVMHRFAEQAPGTFQHSLQVSNLAAEAAKAVDANVLLIRTGALYHDLGKMTAPQYYTENQVDDHNPLLNMSNLEAAQTIISHIKIGCELAQKEHLPEQILQFIRTHHGTSLVRYFYNTEINEHPGETVDESKFRYTGPKPETKEQAILMMADAIEARSRSMKDFTEENVKNMVNDMIDKQIEDGQLKKSPLSFRDIETIKQTFCQRLLAINHHRISYPTANNAND